jgi:hypothetical protein
MVLSGDTQFADAITGVHMGPWDHCTICDLSNSAGIKNPGSSTGLNSVACTGTLTIAVDNAYVGYINGISLVSDARAAGNDNIQGCDGTTTNALGDVMTGCNWQSADVFDFENLDGPLVIGIGNPNGRRQQCIRVIVYYLFSSILSITQVYSMYP